MSRPDRSPGARRVQASPTDTVAPYETTFATVRAGRTAAVAQLRSLADRLERLPLPDAAEALVFLEPVLDDLRRRAALALERAPAGGPRGR